MSMGRQIRPIANSVIPKVPGKEGSMNEPSVCPGAAFRLFLVLVSTHAEPVWGCGVSSALGVSVLPWQADLWVGQILRHQYPLFSCPGCLMSLVALRAAALPRTSSTASEACELLSYYHADWLGIFVFECGTHAARTCARAACAKPHW
jgi:hypothetical protein